MPNIDYEHENTLKKINIGSTDYYLKDEELREAVEGFGTSVSHDAVENLDPVEGTGLPTERAVGEFCAQIIDELREYDINPKVSVEPDEDEGLIFNYIPAPHFDPANPVEINFAPNPNQNDSYLESIQVAMNGPLPSLRVVEMGSTYAESGIPNLNNFWHRTGEPPYETVISAFWVTDPSDRNTAIDTSDNVTRVNNNLTLYPYFAETMAI